MAFVVLGGVAGIAGLLIALAAGGTLRRTALLIVIGLFLAFVWLLVVYFSSTRTDESSTCSDCGAHFGRWLDAAAIMVVLGGNVIAWILGVLAGSGVRRLASPRTR